MTLLKSWLEKKTIVKYTTNKEQVSDIMKEITPVVVLADMLQKDV